MHSEVGEVWGCGLDLEIGLGLVLILQYFAYTHSHACVCVCVISHNFCYGTFACIALVSIMVL